MPAFVRTIMPKIDRSLKTKSPETCNAIAFVYVMHFLRLLRINYSIIGLAQIPNYVFLKVAHF